MKKSISNIAWSSQYDEEMYHYLQELKYDAIEIAPTRLCPEYPYDNIKTSVEKVKDIKQKYGLEISSMQSIWFGRNEKVFGSKEERQSLIEYTKKAIDYANAVQCTNLVFGAPKNRVIGSEVHIETSKEFFCKLGEMAVDAGVIIALEPNPVIYETDFINKTSEAFDFVKMVNSDGLKVNFDLGTVIWNNEDLEDIMENASYINHIHISEPYLEKISVGEIHHKLSELLRKINYNKFISIEMKNFDDIEITKSIVNHVNEVMR
jgi:sugar phosphate isomerase/epimerase